jgi:hypothetical protein
MRAAARYTAVTRARVNLWVFDSDAESRGPMFHFMKRRKLCTEVDMSASAVGQQQEGPTSSGEAATFAKSRYSPPIPLYKHNVQMQQLYLSSSKCSVL